MKQVKISAILLEITSSCFEILMKEHANILLYDQVTNIDLILKAVYHKIHLTIPNTQQSWHRGVYPWLVCLEVNV